MTKAGQDLTAWISSSPTSNFDLDGYTVSGGANADELLGSVPQQWLFGAYTFTLNGNDVFSGQGGDDVMDGRDGADTLQGNAGSDLVAGGDGADYLYGGQNNDTLSGSTGNDTLSGDMGNDQLTGGGGADTFNFGRYGQDVVTDFNRAAGDSVRIDAGSYAYAQSGSNVVVTMDDGSTLTLQNVSLGSLTSGWIHP